MIARLESPAVAARWCEEACAGGAASLGLVPTMGALHAGHLSLVERAVAENDLACASVFVNPLQFDDPRDLERYPRDPDGDAAKLGEVGCAMVFGGTLEGFFPGQLDGRGRLPAELLVDPGPGARGLEGEFRPGHFAGVATIVARLFELLRPDRAYFGRKDFQQCLVVRDLARRRAGPEVRLCDTVREPSGLALSSRNLRLDGPGREQAPFLARALAKVSGLWEGGERDPAALEEAMAEVLSGSTLDVEYAAVRDPEHWTPGRPAGPLERAVALVAARAGAVRLIDNRVLAETP